MKVLSLFSGVGGFDLGLERAGMETVFQCEWDKHATKILERHWPQVPRWGDITTLTGKHILQHAPVIDVVAWGSPCQDLSVAGKRAGLQGERSGLFHHGIRIIKELRELTNGKYPRISIWENVAGALSSSGGADFGQVLYEMDEAGACFSEWRLLDAQYFGIPQRRRRVFVVSVFDSGTAARCPDPLLPVSESVRGDTETSTAEGEAVAGEVAGCLRSGGSGGVPSSRGEHLVVQPFTPSSFAQYENGVGTLRSNGGDLGGGSETLVTFTKSKRAQSVTDDETWVEGEPAPTLNAFDVGDTRATTVIAFENSYRDAARIADGPVNTLSAKMGTGGNNTPMIAFSHTQGLSAQPSETAWPTLRSEGGGHAVAFGIQGTVIGRQDHNGPGGKGHTEENGPMYTLTSTDIHAVAHEAAGFKPGASANAHSIGYEEGLSPSLEAGGGGNNRPAVLEPTMAVRRLTPVECERLMGWPDGWTDGQADTHRYKQCGNGVASPVAQWIGQQLIHL